MVFLIDRRVVYRPEDGSLWLSGDEETAVILTLTMNRLLACFLEKHGQVLTRNELLDSVWDAHGLRSSNHTLNKYISELRKYFTLFGIADECITTIPRVGFMFNSDIDVRVLTETPIAVESQVVNDKAKDRKVARRPWLWDGYKTIFTMLIFFVVIASAILIKLGSEFSSKDSSQMQVLQTYFLFNYGTCPVYTIQKNSVSLSEQKKELFIELAKLNEIHCLEGASFLYQVSESYLYGNKGRAFISRCTSKNKKYISCLNNYWNGYERNQ